MINCTLYGRPSDTFGCVDVDMENKGNWYKGVVRGQNVCGKLIMEWGCTGGQGWWLNWLIYFHFCAIDIKVK